MASTGAHAPHLPPPAPCKPRSVCLRGQHAATARSASRRVPQKNLPRESPRCTASPNAGTHNSLGNEQRPTVFDDKLRTPSDSTRAECPGCTAHRAEARRHAGLRAVGPARAHLHSCDSGCVLARAMLSIVRACLHAMCCPRVTRAPHPRRCITWMVDLAQAYSLVAGDARHEAGAGDRPRSERRARAHSRARAGAWVARLGMRCQGRANLSSSPHPTPSTPASVLALRPRRWLHWVDPWCTRDATRQMLMRAINCRSNPKGRSPSAQATSRGGRGATVRRRCARDARRSCWLGRSLSLSLSLSLVRGRHMRA